MSSEDQPTLRVIRGDAGPEEIAALLAVVSARSAAPAAEEPTVRSAWTDRASLMRRPSAPGPGAWRASGWLR
jgi:acyl-CoA carboxylase epsilon subunit